MLGYPVILNPALTDGTVILGFDGTLHASGHAFVIGTRPRTEIELARYHARWLVQQGLIDVLEWLGETPIPRDPPTGVAIMAALRREATP